MLLPHDPRPCSLTGPNPRQGATLADAHFILKPHIDLLKGDIRRQNGLYFLDQIFFEFGLLERISVRAYRPD